MSSWSLRLESLSDRLNPVAVKELRQIAEGRFILFLLLGLVGAESLFVGGTLLTNSSGQTVAVGRVAFSFLYGILSLSCLLLVPAYIGWRLAAERYGKEMDLIYITAISPRHIVSGKLLSAVALTTLIFSTFLPFLALTYYLRGVDLSSIFGLLVFSFVTVVMATLGAIVLGALPVSRGMKVFLSGGVLLFLLQFAGLGFVAIISVVGRGGTGGFALAALTGGLMSAPPGGTGTLRVWLHILFLIAGLSIVALLLFQIAVAILTPAAANRSRGFRLSLAVCWLLCGAGAVSLTVVYSSAFYIMFWCILFSLVLAAAFFTAVSERHRFGSRIVRGVPARGWRRWKAFLLSSGAASALLFYLAMGMLTLLVTFLVYAFGLGDNDIRDSVEISAGLMMYGLGYSLIGLLILRSLPKGRLHSKRSGLIGLGVLVLASIGPLTLGALLAPEAYWNTETGFRNFLMGNPIALMFDSHRGAYLVLGLVLSAGGLLGNAGWLFDQFESFRPPPATLKRASDTSAGKVEAHG